jgi:predicted acetyltransferase
MEEAMEKIELVKVEVTEKEILRNLMEKYDYEFSQYDNRDVNQLGLYGYDYFDVYWTEKGRQPFFIKVNNCLAGFVMVGDYMEVFKDAQYSMCEFFVMYKYRRKGVGSYAVQETFKKFPGVWELKFHPNNRISAEFWRKLIYTYAHGEVVKITDSPLAEYDDGTYGEVYKFTAH